MPSILASWGQLDWAKGVIFKNKKPKKKQIQALEDGVLRPHTDTRGAERALYRKCHSLTQPLFWSYVCCKLIPSFSSTIPFNEDN
jgi:hypothetical protein